MYLCRSRSIDPIQILPEAQDAVNSIALDQPYIVSGSMDGSVRTYDVRKGIMTSDYVGRKALNPSPLVSLFIILLVVLAPVLSVSLSHDHNCTLVSTLDNTLRLFDRNTGELLNEYKGHLNKLYKVQSRFTYSDEKVVSGSEDGGVFVWDLVESGKMEVLKSHTMTSCCVDCHPRETTIISGSVDGTIVLWQSP